MSRLTDEQVEALSQRCDEAERALKEATLVTGAMGIELSALNSRVAELTKERDEARAMGRAGAYKCTPEHSWAEWLADRQKELDAARARIAELKGALLGLLASPAISDGNHADRGWGCAETAAAESRARAALGRDET
jgi:DNA repair exonuclease SbcCD ATPase subunit